MAAAADGVDVVHSHTWYANLGGHLAGLLHDVPHVVTAHSLEPRRPWKLEQLGGGYRVSSWIERTAYLAADGVIAVSDGMRADVLDCYPELDPARVHVVRNGIDTELYQPAPDSGVAARFGIDLSRPYVLFVGRITRQKGVGHLVAAAHHLDPDVQVVLCAGAPDTPEIGAETKAAVEALQASRDGVVWIADMQPRPDVIELLTGATVFVCPSVYEPLGIVNLEAMACETAVVASDVGGIPEVVVDGEHRTARALRRARRRWRSSETSQRRSTRSSLTRERAAAMGLAGRRRAVEDVQLGDDRRADGGRLPRHAALGAVPVPDLPGVPEVLTCPRFLTCPLRLTSSRRHRRGPCR